MFCAHNSILYRLDSALGILRSLIMISKLTLSTMHIKCSSFGRNYKRRHITNSSIQSHYSHLRHMNHTRLAQGQSSPHLGLIKKSLHTRCFSEVMWKLGIKLQSLHFLSRGMYNVKTEIWRVPWRPQQALSFYNS